MRGTILGITFAALCLTAGVAQADSVTFSGSVPLSITDWSNTITVPRFNPALGTLTSVKFDLSAHIEGSTFYENQENSPTNVSLTLASMLTLKRPDTSTILFANPSTTVNDVAGAFDGVLDFGGTSGNTFNNLFANINQSVTTPLPLSDLALFTGVLPISLPITAEGDSSGSGPGNWIFGFSLSASAHVDVTYNYTPVPEPASLALVGAGCWMLFRRRRA